MNVELELFWKEAVMTRLKYPPHICLEGEKKTFKDLSLDGDPAEI